MLSCFFEEWGEEEEEKYGRDNTRDWEVLSCEVEEEKYNSDDSYMHYCDFLQKYP